MLGITCVFMVAFVLCDFVAFPSIVKTACGLIGALFSCVSRVRDGAWLPYFLKADGGTLRSFHRIHFHIINRWRLVYLSVSSMLGASASVTSLLIVVALLCGFFNVVCAYGLYGTSRA